MGWTEPPLSMNMTPYYIYNQSINIQSIQQSINRDQNSTKQEHRKEETKEKKGTLRWLRTLRIKK